MPLDGLEVANSTPVVHLLHEGITDPWHQLRTPLVFPLLELHRSRYLESVEELTTDLSLRGIEPSHVHVNHSRDEREGGSLYDEMVASNLFL